MQLSKLLSEEIKNTAFYCRPLSFLLAVFLCSLFLFQTSFVWFIVFATVIVLWQIIRIFFSPFRKINKNPLPYLVLVFLLIGAFLPIGQMQSYKILSSMSGEKTVKVVVSREYYEENFGSFYGVKLLEIDGMSVTGNAELKIEWQAELEIYDTVTVKAELSDARKGLSGSELINAKSNNLCLTLEAIEILEITNESKTGVLYNIDVLRAKIGNRLSKFLRVNVAGYASALIIGDKSDLDGVFRNNMSALGISHILAVSGMHLSILSMFVIFIANRFKSSRKVKSLMIIAFALTFMLLAGISPSVVRSAIMLTISMLAVFSGGKSDSLTSLLLSGAIIGVFSPSSILSPSFLLSFFATLGIVMCGLYAERRARARLHSSRVGDMRFAYKLAGKFLFSLLITLCATLFTAPIMALFFNEISFVSVVMNFVAIPFAFLSLLLSVLVLLAGNIPFVGEMVCKIFTVLYDAFEAFAQLVAANFTTTVSLRYPFLSLLGAILFVTLLFLFIRGVKNPLSVIASVAVVAILYGGGVQLYHAFTADRCELVYLANKSSEGFVLSSGSETVYIDVGNGSKALPAAGVELSKEEYYETRLDGFVLTHYHNLHIGTLSKLIIYSEIKTLYLPEPETENEQGDYDAILSIASECEVVMYEKGDALKIGDATLKVFGDYVERSSHPVVAISFTYGQKSVTYIGSSVSESEIYYEAEKAIYSSSAVICGRHGPTNKENDKYLLYQPSATVYLSPYEQIDETVLFPDGQYVYLEADVEGLVISRFALSE